MLWLGLGWAMTKMYFKGNSLQSPIKQNLNYIRVLKRKLLNSAKKIVLVTKFFENFKTNYNFQQKVREFSSKFSWNSNSFLELGSQDPPLFPGLPPFLLLISNTYLHLYTQL